MKARMWLAQAEGYRILELMPVEPEGIDARMFKDRSENAAQQPKKQAIHIYPNPADNEVNVAVFEGYWGEGTVVSAYDATGRRMVRAVPDAKNQRLSLDTKSWQPGLHHYCAAGKRGYIKWQGYDSEIGYESNKDISI